MNNQGFFNYVVDSKENIENLTAEISNQMKIKAEHIRTATEGSAEITQWRVEMAQLQKRLATEPEEAMKLLCAGIEERTGSKEILKRNTEATNKNLLGEKWAKYILR
jgi:hypothetical protein